MSFKSMEDMLDYLVLVEADLAEIRSGAALVEKKVSIQQPQPAAISAINLDALVQNFEKLTTTVTALQDELREARRRPETPYYRDRQGSRDYSRGRPRDRSSSWNRSSQDRYRKSDRDRYRSNSQDKYRRDDRDRYRSSSRDRYRRMTAAGTDQAAGTGLIGAEETDMTRIGVRRVTGIGQQNVTVPGTVTGTLRRTETGARPETGNSRNQSQKTGRSSCGGPSSAATVRS